MKIQSPNRFIPYGRQKISEEDIQSVVEVLRSDFITQGPAINKFEEEVAKYLNVKYAVACSSGTSALHIACLALGLKKGMNAVTSTVTFLASANCTQFVGADVVFSDVTPDTFDLSVEEFENKLQKQKIDFVIPVHLGGHSCDMEEIYDLKKKYNFKIIEDACHAFGSSYKNNKVGSCEFSDIAVFSFHPVKHITTGEGGIATTNDEELYKRLIIYRNHGMHKNADKFVNKNLAYDEKKEPNMWYYEMNEVSHNYRITDIQCALGLSQLKKIDKFVERRRKIAEYYNSRFSEISIVTTPVEKEYVKSSYHLYTLQIDFEKLGRSRNSVMKELRENKIGSQVLYIPVHLQPYYAQKYGYKQGDFPNSENYYKNCLSIPMFPDLSDVEIEYVTDKIKHLLTK